MKRERRRLRFALLSLCTIGVATAAPHLRMSLFHELLAEPKQNSTQCEWSVDSKGLPHVRVQVGDSESIYRCWGWLHARDRAWQMDHLRRIALGQQAEVFGLESIRADFLMRMLGIPERAERLYGELSPASQSKLRAYAAGVNEVFLRELPDPRSPSSQSSPELRELRITPEPWLAWHSVALVLLQSFDQTRRGFEREFVEASLQTRPLSRFGGDSLLKKSREIPDLPWETSILKPGEYPQKPRHYRKQKASKATALRARSVSESVALSRLSQDSSWRQELGLDALDRLLGPSDASKGSNSWVVSPDHSATHRAWLANDPHLKLNTPPIWHWAHLDAGAWNALGGSLPGLPVIASGASQRMAWGMTNSYLDVADLQWLSASRLEGQLETVRPWIWVRLWGPIHWPFFFKSYQRLLSSKEPILPLADPQVPSVSGKTSRPPRLPVLHWTGFELRGADLDPMLELVTASHVEEFDALVQRLGVPSWNFVFADTTGAIGYRANGRVPKRPTGSSVGYVTEDFPQERLTPAEMPHILRPSRGFVVTANNRQWPRDSVVEGGRIQVESFRALRIEEGLRGYRPLTLQDQQTIQCDVQAVDARYFVPILRSLVAAPGDDAEELPSGASAYEQQAWGLLKAWAEDGDYQASLDCQACAVYRRWMGRLEAQLTQDLPTLYRLLLSRLSHAQTAEWQATVALVRESFQVTAAELGARGFPTWSEVHLNSFEHLAGARIFPTSVRQWVSSPGDEHSVNPGSSEWDSRSQRFLQHSGASHRLLVELTNPPTVYARLSGLNRPASAGAEDRTVSQIFTEAGPHHQAWAQCDYEQRIFPFNWDAHRSSGQTSIQQIQSL